MNSIEIRKKFFDFFLKNDHTQVSSSGLIPAQDPTLLFTNAGMNQFKDVFLGLETRSYKRAVSIQKCIRAGGKHNDLDNVGFTKRHLTFFEMMGNFSFGDYFKKEAITFAWNFLTIDLALPKEKLYPSVYEQDSEAFEIWHTIIGIPKEKISKLGAADNFWQMGDTGPCGPCTEIYIDRGVQFGCGEKICAPGCHCDRFLEIWNLVFMQYDRQPDGTDKPLKQTGVDTGMGLERLCAVMQNKDSVFETDLFEPILRTIEKLTKISYATAPTDIRAAFCVLADHIRSSCFAIADGCTPSNEGRGYVLRKIIRRAALFAQKLNPETNIFPELAPILIEHMGIIYPELKASKNHIITLLKSEVEKFSYNLINGQAILSTYFKEQEKAKTITGAQAFKLYDTYGFPLELTNVIAQENGFTVDAAGFSTEMEKQRVQSGKKMSVTHYELDAELETAFTGYDEHITQTKITALLTDNKAVQQVSAGTLCILVTEKSPFYIECGGQISDQGAVKIGSTETPLLGLKKVSNGIGVLIKAPINITIGDAATLIVDSPARINTMKNHTATHLLQAALINIIGKTVKQSGSVVTPDYLRYDFTHHENLTPEQITLVEEQVNQKILENIPVSISQTTFKDAVSKGVIAFFGEKYNPEKVRVVEIPGFSAELCGGTHVRATGDIGCFKIIENTALSAGNRRIVAVTGPEALRIFQENFSTIKTLTQEFKVTSQEVLNAIKKQKDQLKFTQIELKNIKKQMRSMQMPNWLQALENIHNIPVLYIESSDVTQEDLRDMATELIKAKPGFYFIVAQAEPKSHFLAQWSPEFKSKIDSSKLMSWLKEQNMQGGGSGVSVQGTGHIKPEFYKLLKDWLTKNI
jgi:alanyl-tRNA synthetase